MKVTSMIQHSSCQFKISLLNRINRGGHSFSMRDHFMQSNNSIPFDAYKFQSFY
mgnify:CR=1 FL=1